VLDAAPNISIPDDHEYWNNFPHASPFIQNSWTEEGRARWGRAAQAMFNAFQLPYPNSLSQPPESFGEAFILDVPPLSLFIADTRSGRDSGLRFTMPDNQHQQLTEWVDSVIAEKRFGVFVSSQSLFANPVSSTKGAISDYELPNYGDFGRIIQTLQRLIDEGSRALICLTGDVHWGRITASQDITTGRTAITEIISSPSSLVTTVGVDTIKRVGGFFRRVFGNPDPWPRHSTPSDAPDFFASGVLGGRFRNATIHKQEGNNVALLRFRRTGGGVECRVTYWPIHADRAIASPTALEPFYLASA
jgi:hypothetical protein